MLKDSIDTNALNRDPKKTAIIAALLVAGGIIFSSWYTIDESERGVLLRNGALVKVVEPGLSFKMPFFESVRRISIQSFSTKYEGLPAYSSDQQTANLTVSVSWRVDPSKVDEVYTRYRDVQGLLDRLITRNIQTQTENVFGQYTAVKAVQNRTQFVADVQKAIRDAIRGPVIIESVQVENIDFNDDYERAISERMKAEVEVKTREQSLKTEQVQAQIRVTQAKAEADSQLAKAEAQAKAIRLIGQAEADAVRLKAEALNTNPRLVELTKAEKWNGTLPTHVIPNGALPFVDVSK